MLRLAKTNEKSSWRYETTCCTEESNVSDGKSKYFKNKEVTYANLSNKGSQVKSFLMMYFESHILQNIYLNITLKYNFSLSNTLWLVIINNSDL